MAHKLIQIFLPLHDNEGNRFIESQFKDLQRKLTKKFKGVTIYQRAPVKGLWKEEFHASVMRDDLIIYEVIAEQVEITFWDELKSALLKQFRQQELLIRSSDIELL